MLTTALLTAISLFSSTPIASCDALEHFDVHKFTADVVMCEQSHAVGFSQDQKGPEWVAYNVVGKNLPFEARAHIKRFEPRPEIPAEFAPEHRGFLQTGYLRVSLAPPMHYAMSDAEYASAISVATVTPMSAKLYRGDYGNLSLWDQLNEIDKRNVKRRGDIHVISGAIFWPGSEDKTISNDVGVPTHYYRVYFDPSVYAVSSYIVPNSKPTSSRLSDYARPIDCVEHYTGLKFLDALPKDVQDDLENGRANSITKWALRDGSTQPSTHCTLPR